MSELIRTGSTEFLVIGPPVPQKFVKLWPDISGLHIDAMTGLHTVTRAWGKVVETYRYRVDDGRESFELLVRTERAECHDKP